MTKHVSSKTSAEINDGARRMAELLIEDGFAPTDVLAAMMNGCVVLANITGAQSGYVTNDGKSVLLSQQGQEKESIDFIEERQAEANELSIKQQLADAAELSAKSGGADNVTSIFNNK